MRMVTFEALEKYQEYPKRLVSEIGRGPVRFLLREETASSVFEGLNEKLPSLSIPKRHGIVAALFRTRDELLKSCKCMSEGFVLPLEWRKESYDSPRLPNEIRKVAKRARDVLEIPSYGLHLAEELGDVDFSQFGVEAESIFVSLAAGLYIAHHGGTPNPSVFATGAWHDDPGGLKPINGLEGKLAGIARLDCKKPILFVPEQNAKDAEEIVSRRGYRTMIMTLDQGKPDLLDALMDCLAHLEAPPQPDAPLLNHCRYLNLQHIRKKADLREEHYFKVIDKLGEAMLARSTNDCIKNAGIQSLALFASVSSDLTCLLIEALQPKHLLLCYTPNNSRVEKSVQNLKGRYKTRIDTFKEKQIKGDILDEAVEEVSNWFAGFDNREGNFVEVTGGTTEMTVALIMAAQKASAKVLYLRSNYDRETRTAEAGSENIFLVDLSNYGDQDR